MTKHDIKRSQKWRKGVSRKGLNLAETNSPKLNKHTKRMSPDELYDYIVNGGK